MRTQVDLMAASEAPSRPSEEAGLGCLTTERGNLPLETINVQAVITGLASSIKITEGFQNPHAEPLEATYVFPLPARAAVTALRMEADGRVVEGVLKERAEARASYDLAITEGKRASIAEEERPGVFTMRVGNIMPGERVSVQLTLAGSLSYEDGEATFRLPLVVAPRYIPGEPLDDDQVGDGVAPDTDAVPDASRISPPVLLPGFPNPVRLSVAVDIDPVGLPLDGVSSSLYTTATEDESARLRVRLHPGERADRDFLLRLRFGADDAITTSLAVLPDDPGDDPDGGGTFALTVLPPSITPPTRGRDVVLVLDRSGSMGGWKMVAARRAAARIVDTLGVADRFAVLAFDHQVTTPPGLPADLVEASDRNRFRAVAFLSSVDARGGTEMLSPLRHAAELLGEGADHERVLVLVTDGQIGNEDQLLRELAPGLTGVRVHTVGIDRAVNEAFLQRLAGSAGHCELVESEDRLDDAMRHVHRRIGTPVATGLRVTPAGLAAIEESMAPAPTPDLYPGAPVVVMGRFTGPASGDVTVTSDGDWRETITAERSDNPSLAALWARARIRDLEDRYVVGQTDQKALERRIVETSLTYGVLSRFTAFLAVDERVVNEGGSVHRVTQPVDLPSGWEPLASMPAPGGAAPMARSMPTFGTASARLTWSAPEAGRLLGGGRRPARRGELGAPGGLFGHQPASPEPGDVGEEEARRRSGSVSSAGVPAGPGIGGGLGAVRPPVVPPPGSRMLDILAKELRALRGAAARSSSDHADLLTALAARLKGLLGQWRAASEPAAALTTVDALITILTSPTDDPGEVERRWSHTITTLEALTKTKHTGSRRTFWKR